MKGYARRRLRLLWVLGIHLMLPLWFILLMATVGQEDSSVWLAIVISAAAYVACISIAGSWSWFGVYGQRAIPLVITVAAFVTRPRYRVVNASPEAAEMRLACLAGTLLFMVLTLWALLGRRPGRDSLDLGFPLKGGTFVVAQGGSTRPVNSHVRKRAERHAVDLVKLGNMGLRAEGIYPVALKKYAVFGLEVISPCDGVVVSAVDDLPDSVPPERNVEQPAGNHIAIEKEGVRIYLCHLMKGSVTVDIGQRVRAGKILARVGNSGDSLEPHLHIHAQRDVNGIAIRFNGRYLVRNDSVEAKE